MSRPRETGAVRIGFRSARSGAATLVLAAFVLGVGPGTAVQPCPKHRPAAASDGAVGSHGHDGSHAAAHAGSHTGAHGTDPSPHGGHAPHSDGPCDCLGTCLACFAPALAYGSRAVAQRPATAAPLRTFAGDGTPRGQPAPYLRPFARPPPAA